MLTGPKTKIVHFTTLFKTRETIFMSLIHFVSHTELNNFKTDITESDFFGK